MLAVPSQSLEVTFVCIIYLFETIAATFYSDADSFIWILP